MIEHSTAYSSIALRYRSSGRACRFDQRGVHHADGAVDHRLADVERTPPSAPASRGSVRSRRSSCRRPCAPWRKRSRSPVQPSRAADAARAQLEAADVQDVEGDDVSLADLAEHVLDRHLAVVEDERAGRRAANAHLLLFRADGEAGEIAFDEERGELLAIDLREDGEQIGEVRVRDPHLLAVQDVVLAVGREHGLACGCSARRSRWCFRQRVSADHLARRQLRQILLLLLLGAEEDDRQRADAGVSAQSHQKLPYFAMRSAMMADVTLSMSRPPYSAGMSTLVRPISPAFFSSSRDDGQSLCSIFFDGGHDFVGRELLGELRDHLLLFVEIFRSKDVVEVVIFEQETSARGLVFLGAAVVVAISVSLQSLKIVFTTEDTEVTKLTSPRGRNHEPLQSVLQVYSLEVLSRESDFELWARLKSSPDTGSQPPVFT